MFYLETRSALASENFDEANRKLKEAWLEMNLLFKIFIHSHYMPVGFQLEVLSTHIWQLLRILIWKGELSWGGYYYTALSVFMQNPQESHGQRGHIFFSIQHCSIKPVCRPVYIESPWQACRSKQRSHGHGRSLLCALFKMISSLQSGMVVLMLWDYFSKDFFRGGKLNFRKLRKFLSLLKNYKASHYSRVFS